MSAHLISRRSLIGAAGGLTLLGLTACSRDTTNAGGVDAVNYQLSWTHSVQFGGTYLAKDLGLFTEQGLDVSFAPGGPNVAGDASTVSGASLVNISAADGVGRSNEEGADLVIVGAQYQKSAATILSLADAPLQTPDDLRGKKIGVATANNPALSAFLSINDMSESDIEFVPSQYDPAVLTAGQVDGLYCFYNDLPVALTVQGVENSTMLLADFGYNPMSQTYTVNRSSLEDDAVRDQLVRLIRADAQGWQVYEDDPEAAAELTLDMYPDAGLDLDTQLEQSRVQLDIMFSDATAEHGFGWFSDEQVEENLRLFELLGISGGTEDLWDRSLLEEIYRDGSVA